MEKNLIELVKGINLSSTPIAAIKFSNYNSKAMSARSASTDCCYGADCGDCDCGGYCADCGDCCDSGGDCASGD